MGRANAARFEPASRRAQCVRSCAADGHRLRYELLSQSFRGREAAQLLDRGFEILLMMHIRTAVACICMSVSVAGFAGAKPSDADREWNEIRAVDGRMTQVA